MCVLTHLFETPDFLCRHLCAVHLEPTGTHCCKDGPFINHPDPPIVFCSIHSLRLDLGVEHLPHLILASIQPHLLTPSSAEERNRDTRAQRPPYPPLLFNRYLLLPGCHHSFAVFHNCLLRMMDEAGFAVSITAEIWQPGTWQLPVRRTNEKCPL